MFTTSLIVKRLRCLTAALFLTTIVATSPLLAQNQNNTQAFDSTIVNLWRPPVSPDDQLVPYTAILRLSNDHRITTAKLFVDSTMVDDQFREDWDTGERRVAFSKTAGHNLPDGLHEMKVELTVIGPTHNRIIVNAISFRIDTTPPQVTLQRNKTDAVNITVTDASGLGRRITLKTWIDDQQKPQEQEIQVGAINNRLPTFSFSLNPQTLDLTNTMLTVVDMHGNATSLPLGALSKDTLAKKMRKASLNALTTQATTNNKSNMSMGAAPNGCGIIKIVPVIPYYSDEPKGLNKAQSALHYLETTVFPDLHDLMSFVLELPGIENTVVLDTAKAVLLDVSAPGYQNTFSKSHIPLGSHPYNGAALEDSSNLEALLFDVVQGEEPESLPMLYVADIKSQVANGFAIPWAGVIAVKESSWSVHPETLENSIAVNASTLFHELGHILGLAHWTDTIMDGNGYSSYFENHYFTDSQKIAFLAHLCGPNKDSFGNGGHLNFLVDQGGWRNPYADRDGGVHDADPNCGNAMLDEEETCEWNVRAGYRGSAGWNGFQASYATWTGAMSADISAVSRALEWDATTGLPTERNTSLLDNDAQVNWCSGALTFKGERADLIPGTEACQLHQASKEQLKGPCNGHAGDPYCSLSPFWIEQTMHTPNYMQDCDSNCPAFLFSGSNNSFFTSGSQAGNGGGGFDLWDSGGGGGGGGEEPKDKECGESQAPECGGKCEDPGKKCAPVGGLIDEYGFGIPPVCSCIMSIGGGTPFDSAAY